MFVWYLALLCLKNQKHVVTSIFLLFVYLFLSRTLPCRLFLSTRCGSAPHRTKISAATPLQLLPFIFLRASQMYASKYDAR